MTHTTVWRDHRRLTCASCTRPVPARSASRAQIRLSIHSPSNIYASALVTLTRRDSRRLDPTCHEQHFRVGMVHSPPANYSRPTRARSNELCIWCHWRRPYQYRMNIESRYTTPTYIANERFQLFIASRRPSHLHRLRTCPLMSTHEHVSRMR